ncbi:inovirus-type Gp2 protein [Escherichia coli]|uniref:YagK/YfjJ domain-containing protein n=1 Tax=Escherichia coli TaxID=562 RepID=UPI00288C09D2|nr:inovirus-type Gp2 protein [Escherichia coli]
MREILISESTWEEMTCLFAPSLIPGQGINKAIPSLMADFTGELHRLISEYLQCKRRKDQSVEPTPLYYLWSREAVANDTTPYLMVLLLNNDVWCKSREVVVLRNLIEQAWGKVLGEDNSITHLVVYPEVLSLVFDAANTYNAEPGVLEQTAELTLNHMVPLNVILGVVTFNVR